MSNAFTFDDDEQPPFGEEPTETDETPEAEEGESGNKTFMIAAIVLGSLVLFSIICMAIYALVIYPNQRTASLAAEAAQTATMDAVNTEAAFVVQQTQDVLYATPSLAPTETPTPRPTNTPLLVEPATPTLDSTQQAQAQAQGTVDPTQANINALNTQLANAQLTATLLPSATALARTGFMDEVGVPGMFIAAVILVAVILLSRRLRAVPTR
jgi:hypothetical protein